MEKSEKEKTQLIELTKKRIKKHMAISAILGVIGALLLYNEEYSWGFGILAIAIIWGLIARFMAWWYHG